MAEKYQHLKRSPLNPLPKPNGIAYNSIKENLRQGFNPLLPIYTFQGYLLKGNARLQACIELGIEPVIKEFDGTKEEARRFVFASFVKSELTSSQRAATAFDFPEIIQEIEDAVERERRAKKTETNQEGKKAEDLSGTEVPDNPDDSKSAHLIALRFGTNRRFIAIAKKLNEYDPVRLAQVKAGIKSMDAANKSYEGQLKASQPKAMAITKRPHEVAYFCLSESQSGQKLADGDIFDYAKKLDLSTLSITDDSTLFVQFNPDYELRAKQLIAEWGFKTAQHCVVQHDHSSDVFDYFKPVHDILLVCIRGNGAPLTSSPKSRRSIIKDTEVLDAISDLFPTSVGILSLFAEAEGCDVCTYDPSTNEFSVKESGKAE